jgi:hypothetical protein
LLESKHFDGRDGGFISLVAMLSSRSVKGLLLSVGGEDPKDYWFIVFQTYLGDSMCHRIADKVKVAGLSLNHTAQTDDCIYLILLRAPLCTECQFKGTRNLLP